MTQRFCIAILQKMSIKEDLVDLLLKNKMLDWIVKLIERSTAGEIHTFSLDFGSALLANILHANSALDFLEKSPAFTKSVSQNAVLTRVDHGTVVRLDKENNSYVRPDACPDLSFLFKQGKILSPCRAMPICGQDL